MIEIERKFLVLSNAFQKEAMGKNRIVQGYLSSDPERTVRIRIKGNKGYLTVKGKGNSSGMSRLEWEKEIETSEVEMLLPLCEQGIIEKERYDIKNLLLLVLLDLHFANHQNLFRRQRFHYHNQKICFLTN